MAITISDLRDHIETDAVDAVLTRILAVAVADVEARFGDDAERTEVKDGKSRSIFLHRPASSISSVSVAETNSSTLTAITTSDYASLHGGRTLRRTTAAVWEPVVSVVYTPVSESALRDMLVVELSRAALSYQGLVSVEKVGDYAADLREYTAEREKLFQQVVNHRGFNIR